MNYDHVKYPIRKVNYIPSKIVLPEFWFLVYLELQKFGLYFLFTAWLCELSLENVFKWLNAKDYLVGIENRIRKLFVYLLWVRIIYFIHYYGKEYSDTFFCVSELETAWNLYTYIFVCVCMCICVCVCIWFYFHLGFPGCSDSKKSTCNVRDLGWNPGFWRSPGEGNSYPLQYPCLENSMEREAWQATVHRVAKSRTWPSDFYFHFSFQRLPWWLRG